MTKILGRIDPLIEECYAEIIALRELVDTTRTLIVELRHEEPALMPGMEEALKGLERDIDLLWRYVNKCLELRRTGEEVIAIGKS